MASFDFQDKEDRTRRRQQGIKIGQLIVRTYNIPADAIDTMLPSRGDVVALRDVTLDTSALLRPRVLHNPRRKRNEDGGYQVEITFIVPEAYS